MQHLIETFRFLYFHVRPGLLASFPLQHLPTAHLSCDTVCVCQIVNLSRDSAPSPSPTPSVAIRRRRWWQTFRGKCPKRHQWTPRDLILRGWDHTDTWEVGQYKCPAHKGLQLSSHAEETEVFRCVQDTVQFSNLTFSFLDYHLVLIGHICKWEASHLCSVKSCYYNHLFTIFLCSIRLAFSCFTCFLLVVTVRRMRSSF